MRSLILRFSSRTSQKGMTLVETLVAISILALAILAPMSLTMQSLSAAYYARDLIVASNLAQEAIEAVRALRDGNILAIALNTAPSNCTADTYGADDGQAFHLLCGIPIGQEFTVDARTATPEVSLCSGPCPKLKTDGDLYGHEDSWTQETPYRRTVYAEYVGGGQDEIRLTVTVERETAIRPPPPVVIQENLYRWVNDGTSE